MVQVSTAVPKWSFFEFLDFRLIFGTGPVVGAPFPGGTRRTSILVYTGYGLRYPPQVPCCARIIETSYVRSPYSTHDGVRVGYVRVPCPVLFTSD